LPSDIIAAFLFAQIENIEDIQQKRLKIWNQYYDSLRTLEENGKIRLPYVPKFATNNAHMFYIICKNLEQRNLLTQHLKSNGINAVFHYQSLHKSGYYAPKHDKRELPQSDFYTDTLLRLPLFYSLTENEVDFICNTISNFSDFK
jgi:dTDP-4-amino-4,6-dideoxygalactose transaminase